LLPVKNSHQQLGTARGFFSGIMSLPTNPRMQLLKTSKIQPHRRLSRPGSPDTEFQRTYDCRQPSHTEIHPLALTGLEVGWRKLS
jgi:hypothetical protein